MSRYYWPLALIPTCPGATETTLQGVTRLLEGRWQASALIR